MGMAAPSGSEAYSGASSSRCRPSGAPVRFVRPMMCLLLVERGAIPALHEHADRCGRPGSCHPTAQAGSRSSCDPDALVELGRPGHQVGGAVLEAHEVAGRGAVRRPPACSDAGSPRPSSAATIDARAPSVQEAQRRAGRPPRRRRRPGRAGRRGFARCPAGRSGTSAWGRAGAGRRSARPYRSSKRLAPTDNVTVRSAGPMDESQDAALVPVGRAGRSGLAGSRSARDRGRPSGRGSSAREGHRGRGDDVEGRHDRGRLRDGRPVDAGLVHPLERDERAARPRCAPRPSSREWRPRAAGRTCRRTGRSRSGVTATARPAPAAVQESSARQPRASSAAPCSFVVRESSYRPRPSTPGSCASTSDRPAMRAWSRVRSSALMSPNGAKPPPSR